MKYLISIFILPLMLFGQNGKMYQTETLFAERAEVYFALEYAGSKALPLLNQMVYIDHLNSDTLFAYANRWQFEALIRAGYQPVLRTPPSMQGEPPRMIGVDDIGQVNTWEAYPTYEAYEAIMLQFADDYPELCTLHTIATLANGRKIQVLNIRSTPDESIPKPEVYYTATMHGDELAGYVLSLHLIDYLLSNYGEIERITYLVDNLNIWINPLANPDGAYAAGNHSVWGATRGNANGIDLNRNYPDPRVGANPDGNAYQPETVAFMEFEAGRNFVLSANWHGGAEVANYPWDTWFKRTADDDWWMYVTREYADTAQYHSPPGYFTALNNGITNGYDWYSITGGRQDYMNYFRNCREFTLELSDLKTPPESQLIPLWEWNYRSFLNYFEQALFGIRGVVTNGETGLPVQALVSIQGHDQDNSHVNSKLPSGGYNRLLKAGTYDVTFSALGYYSRTYEGIAVTDRGTYILDVELFTASIMADFTADQTEIAKGESIQFSDASYGEDIIGWAWEFEGGEPGSSSAQHPEAITYNQTGSFSVSLTVTNAQDESHTLTREDFIQVSDKYNMQNGTFYTCEGLFFDSGGESGQYQNNEDYTLTFFPDADDHAIKVSFIEYHVEPHSNCEYDRLMIYNGSNVEADLIGIFCGTNSPGEIVATNADGALTFRFISDGSVTASGWKATVECTTSVGVTANTRNVVLLTPNPALHGSFTVKSDEPIRGIGIIDSRGRQHAQFAGNNRNQQLIQARKLPSGLYVVSIETSTATYYRKLLVY